MPPVHNAFSAALLALCDYVEDLARKEAAVEQLKQQNDERCRNDIVLPRELAVEDSKTYTNALRMNVDLFNELLSMIEPTIRKQDTGTAWRPALNPRLKLEVTLRYLASGDSFKTLSLFFKGVSASSISIFLPEVLQAIYTSLADSLKVPQTAEEWRLIARQFAQVCNFPKCCGAIDGKYIKIRQPSASADTDFCNVKGFYSTVLLALVDANYNFIYVNTGTHGKANDAGIFEDSALLQALEMNSLCMPAEHVILGNSAFPLKPYLMKPYAYKNANEKQTVFNYRLSRARRIVENAFGILVWRFQVFAKPINLKARTVDHVVLAACSLHNWLRSRSANYMAAGNVDEEDANTGEVIPGQWRDEITQLRSARPCAMNEYTQAAKHTRDQFANFFWEEGVIPSQWQATGVDPDFEDKMEEDGDNSDSGHDYEECEEEWCL